jgi:predicted NBD/HSP70 family sugar kinase
MLADRIRLPIYVENDATSAALGEMQFGALPDVTDFFYVFIGIGLGGGLVLDGRPCRGATGRSGELGFMAIAGGNPREKYLADVVSLNVLYRRLAKAGHAAATPAALMALNDEARGIVEAWLDDAALHLSQAFAAIACLVNPDTIYLGGRLPQAMLEALCRRIEARGREARAHFSDMPRIALATRTEDAAVLGAAVLPIAAMLLPGDAALRTAGRG